MLLHDTDYHSSRRYAVEVARWPSRPRRGGSILSWARRWCERLLRTAVIPPSTTFYLFGVEAERCDPAKPGAARSK